MHLGVAAAAAAVVVVAVVVEGAEVCRVEVVEAEVIAAVADELLR
jgi:hypothetical protein